MKKFKEISGTLINFNTTHSNIILTEETKLLWGDSYIEEEIEGRKFKISSDSFFQVNPKAAALMFNKVREIILERIKKPSILDVYSGVGNFSIWLKDVASKIVAIEENKSSVNDAFDNIKLNAAKGDAKINIIKGKAEKILNKLVGNEEIFDVVLLDPPRRGCAEESLRAVTKLALGYIIYVSCNPSTLARDIKYLQTKGFHPEFAIPLDMFSHTYHIETIALLKRKK